MPKSPSTSKNKAAPTKAVAKPKTAASKPKAAASKPKAAGAKPKAAPAKPKAAAAKPKPAVAKPKPAAAKTATVTYGVGTAADPWLLKTPPQSSEYQAWKDEDASPPALVVQVGSTRLSYQLRCIEDLAAMLKRQGDWVLLGNADEGKPTPDGSVEAWARSPKNPVGGYYGLRKGYRGRFANYVPPVLELLGLIELEHGPRNNRAKSR